MARYRRRTRRSSSGSLPGRAASRRGASRSELVTAFALLAPGAAASRVVEGLVASGPEAAPKKARLPAAQPGEPAALAGLRAFADTLQADGATDEEPS